MTAEEKAKEITMKHFEITEYCFEQLLLNKEFVYNFYNGVLNGLTEGRKEVEQEKCELLGIIQGKDVVIAELRKALNNNTDTASATQLMELIQVREENERLTKDLEEMKAQVESLKETLRAIATDTNEHITHNVAQNELDKWEPSRMTELEKLEKQLTKAKNAMIKADNEIQILSSILHKMGYLYNAEFMDDEINFVPCDENYDTINAFDEHYCLEDLVKNGS